MRTRSRTLSWQALLKPFEWAADRCPLARGEDASEPIAKPVPTPTVECMDKHKPTSRYQSTVLPSYACACGPPIGMKIVSSVRLSIELAWKGEEVIFDGVADEARRATESPLIAQ
jgi:hypothetical protein